MHEPPHDEKIGHTGSDLKGLTKIPNELCIAGSSDFDGKNAAVRGLNLNKTLTIENIREINFTNVASDQIRERKIELSGHGKVLRMKND